MNKKEVLVVSAFGRGHWLAVHLKRNGIESAIIDVTEKMGTWIPEDAEGPFGFFQSDKMLESQYERLIEEEAPIEMTNGFTIWLNDGPVELKGPVGKRRLEKLDVQDETVQYLLGQGKGLQKARLSRLPFSQKWLVCLAHGFTANEYHPSAEYFETEEFAALFAKYFVRLPSRVGHSRSLDWCERQGVEVVRKSDIIDISLKSRREVRGVEYRHNAAERTEIFECEQMVWCLTSEETGMLGIKPQQNLFPHGILEPSWVWTRYRLKVPEAQLRELLPMHVLVIDDIGRPWTHDNFVVLQKTGSADLFDAWCKLPNVQRFNKEYLASRGQGITNLLRERLVGMDVEVVNQPVGYDLTYNQAGPARHPIYDPTEKLLWRPGQFSNVHFDSAEQWRSLGWNGIFQKQNEVMNNLQLWWNKKIAKLKKEAGAEL
jgi:hypothetical protein